MLNQFSRTQLLFGAENMEKLKNARVAVFGIGGVGGYVVEALVRSGVGAFVLIDDDKVCLTNLNRQIIATRKTVGKYKTEVMKERILEINPEARVELRQCFFLPENADEFDFRRIFLCGRCGGYSDGEAGDHHAGQGGRCAGHQLHGSRKPSGPHQLPGGRHL